MIFARGWIKYRQGSWLTFIDNRKIEKFVLAVNSFLIVTLSSSSWRSFADLYGNDYATWCLFVLFIASIVVLQADVIEC